jgi:hypothetical protein
MTIAENTFTVTQASGCTYSIIPTSASYAAAGGTGSVSVTTQSTCLWTATSNVSWITITSGASGTGNGTVNSSVSANSDSARTGTITIAGQTFTVSQGAAYIYSGCSYFINPTSAAYPSSGGNGSTSVTTTNGCSWTATSNASWITVTSGASGTGSGSVEYSVAVNTAEENRTGGMTIGGQLFSLTQEGNPTVIDLVYFTAYSSDKMAILEWVTASEIDNAGFNLYRSEEEDGVYVKINRALIPSEGSPTEGMLYQFADEDVKNLKTYYYKLEDIDIYGKSALHGPVSAMPKKIQR